MDRDLLIQHLVAVAQALAKSDALVDEKILLNHLYFALTEERLRMQHVTGYNAIPFQLSQQQRFEHELLRFRPQFEVAIQAKKCTSIIEENFFNQDRRVTDRRVQEIIKQVRHNESTRGLFYALLVLRDLALSDRTAANYLRAVIARLYRFLKGDQDIERFLDWCVKKTLKVFPWGNFSSKERRTPPKAVLPIFQDEAVVLLDYFLEASNSAEKLRGLHAEMVVFLLICLASARKMENCFTREDVLKVTSADVYQVSERISKERKLYFSSPDIIEPSPKTEAHQVLSLRISPDFLSSQSFWPLIGQENTANNAHQIDAYYVTINHIPVLMSKGLAVALQKMGKFNLTARDVENRLKKAGTATGLFNGRGKPSTRCFLFRVPSIR